MKMKIPNESSIILEYTLENGRSIRIKIGQNQIEWFELVILIIVVLFQFCLICLFSNFQFSDSDYICQKCVGEIVILSLEWQLELEDAILSVLSVFYNL